MDEKHHQGILVIAESLYSGVPFFFCMKSVRADRNQHEKKIVKIYPSHAENL